MILAPPGWVHRDPPLPYSAVFSALGSIVRLQTNDERVRDAVARILLAPSGRETRPDITLSIILTPSREKLPTAERVTSLLDGAIAVTAGQSLAVADFARRSISIECTADDVNNAPLFGKSLIEQVIIDCALASSDGWGLHAAGLISPSGHGIAICGPRGSGKSTLALGLALEGYTLVSDDLLLYSGTAEHEFSGLAGTLSAGADADALMGENLADDWFYRPSGPYRGRLRTSRFPVRQEMPRLSAIVLPQHSEVLEPLVRELTEDDDVDLELRSFTLSTDTASHDRNDEQMNRVFEGVDFLHVGVTTRPRTTASVLDAKLSAL